MRIATVALHHEALTHWAAYRRTCADAPELLTLDFHTDVLSCLRRGVPAPPHGVWRDEAAVAAAVKQLRHDEQIDWALRGVLISRAVAAALSPASVPPEHPALTVRRFPGMPDPERILNDPEGFRDLAERVLTDEMLSSVLPAGGMASGFVLDIDCDLILCRRALEPAAHAVLDDLFRRAGLVSISREVDWVRLLKLPDETLDGGTVAAILERYGEHVVADSDL